METGPLVLKDEKLPLARAPQKSKGIPIEKILEVILSVIVVFFYVYVCGKISEITDVRPKNLTRLIQVKLQQG